MAFILSSMPSSESQHTPSLPSTSGRRIEIHPVTKVSDIPILATISELALKPDNLFDFRIRYGSPPLYDDTVTKLTNALNDTTGRMFVFKAISVLAGEADGAKEEVIVGYSQWSLGYLETPKVDPFAVRETQADSERNSTFEANALTVAVSDVKELPAVSTRAGRQASVAQKSKPFYSHPDQELSRKMGNAYISAIRGKRHLALRRLIVHPAYQRQGIGQKLLEWGMGTADRENVVSWLFARPAGSKLYERNGWKVCDILDIDVPEGDAYVAPTAAMLRLPRKRG